MIPNRLGTRFSFWDRICREEAAEAAQTLTMFFGLKDVKSDDVISLLSRGEPPIPQSCPPDLTQESVTDPTVLDLFHEGSAWTTLTRQRIGGLRRLWHLRQYIHDRRLQLGDLTRRLVLLLDHFPQRREILRHLLHLRRV